MNFADVFLAIALTFLFAIAYRQHGRIKRLEGSAQVPAPVEVQKPVVTWGVEYYHKDALTLMDYLVSGYLGLIPGKDEEVVAIRDEELPLFLQYCVNEHIPPNYQKIQWALKNYSRFEQRLETLYNRHKATTQRQLP